MSEEKKGFTQPSLSELKSWIRFVTDENGEQCWIDLLEKETGQESYFGFHATMKKIDDE